MKRWQKLLMMSAAAAVTLTVMPTRGWAQIYSPGFEDQRYAPVYSPAPQQISTYSVALTDQQLEEIAAPIALYPDPLLADVLAASTFPEQLNQVADALRNNPNIANDDNFINAQPWPDAVKVLAHYPEIITFLTSRPDYTGALGASFAEQQDGLMAAVQRLRAEAQAAGSLYTTDQQQVLANSGYIQILPAQPDYIYVPQYDPAVVYVVGAGRDRIRFDDHDRYRTGPWLTFGFDWDHRTVDRAPAWDRDHYRDYQAHRDVQPWHRDDHYAKPVMPAPVVNRFNNDAKRGYVPQPPQHPVFNAGDNRQQVQAAEERARQSRPAAPVHPAPAPRAVQPVHPATPPPRPVTPPHPVAPAAQPAPQPQPRVVVPHPEANPGVVPGRPGGPQGDDRGGRGGRDNRGG